MKIRTLECSAVVRRRISETRRWRGKTPALGDLHHPGPGWRPDNPLRRSRRRERGAHATDDRRRCPDQDGERRRPKNSLSGMSCQDMPHLVTENAGQFVLAVHQREQPACHVHPAPGRAKALGSGSSATLEVHMRSSRAAAAVSRNATWRTYPPAGRRGRVRPSAPRPSSRLRRAAARARGDGGAAAPQGREGGDHPQAPSPPR